MCLAPNKTTHHVRACVRMHLYGCTRTCTLKPRAIGSLRMAEYSATVIDGLKNSASLKLLFYSSRIRLGPDTTIDPSGAIQ